MSKFVIALAIVLPLITAAVTAQAADKTIKFNFSKSADITDVIQAYAKESGQKFIIDPQVRGRVTIINNEPITMTEAFNQLASALATNGLAYVEQEGVTIIKQARNAQRDNIPVVTELPPLRPERMMTYMITLKYARAQDVNRELRILTSKDGELVPVDSTNQIIVSDYTPNLHRIANILKNLDTPEAVKNARPPGRPDKDGPPHFRPKPKGETTNQ